MALPPHLCFTIFFGLLAIVCYHAPWSLEISVDGVAGHLDEMFSQPRRAVGRTGQCDHVGGNRAHHFGL